jgi:hypothetical protein
MTYFQSKYFRNVQKNHHLMIHERLRASFLVFHAAYFCVARTMLVLFKRNDSEFGINMFPLSCRCAGWFFVARAGNVFGEAGWIAGCEIRAALNDPAFRLVMTRL